MASMHMQMKKLGASIERYGAKHGYIYERIWKRVLVNNNVWWNKTPLFEVLRDFGVHMRMGPMLGRDT
jgi:tyrosyl-tRNA synthetase